MGPLPLASLARRVLGSSGATLSYLDDMLFRARMSEVRLMLGLMDP